MISEAGYKFAAGLLGCDVPAVKAVREVESGGAGFYKSGKIVIKFEGHIFHKYTKGKFAKAYPAISYPSWTEQHSVYGEGAYIRFNQAFRLDPYAALMSTSWGLFQVMGFNYSSCGFHSVGEFVDFLKKGEDNHLDAFCRYVLAQGLAKYLVKHQWASFAYRYNGAAYKKNSYDLLLAHAYDHFKP